MNRGLQHRPHLMEIDADPPLRKLPRGLASRKTPADHFDPYGRAQLAFSAASLAASSAAAWAAMNHSGGPSIGRS